MKKRNGINIDDELENIIDSLDGRDAEELGTVPKLNPILVA